MSADYEPVTDIKGRPHIVIHSGQMLQNLLPMMALGAKKFLVIHSSGMKPDGLIGTAQLLGLECAGHEEIDAGDVNSSISKLDAWRKKTPDFDFSEAILNYSGGTKSMSLAAVAAWSGHVQECIYFDSGALHRMKAGLKWKIPNKWTVAQLLQANGFADSHSAGRMTFKLSSDPSGAMREVARKFCTKKYMDWLGIQRRTSNTLPKEKHAEALKEAGVSRNCAELKPTFFEGIWLEVWVWDVLTRHKAELELDDIQHSVQVFRADGDLETDLDVAFTKRGRLGFISCKTSRAEELFDEIWEVAVRRSQLGGAFGMGMLVHWHKSPQEGQKKTASQKYVQKAIEAASKAVPAMVLFDRECLLDEKLFVQKFKKCIGAARS